jgi:hypothetical protein
MISASTERRASSDVEPHAISRVTKSKMVTVDAIANNETSKFKDVGDP